MAYIAFNQSTPDPSTQNITLFGQSTRDNLKAIRDAVITSAMLNWNYWIPSGTFTASISGTTMTVTAASTWVVPGMTISGTGVTGGTKIVSQLTGTQFGVGTYQVSISHGTVASTTITEAPADNSIPPAYLYSKSPETVLALLTWDGSSNITSGEYWYHNGTAWDRIGKETFTYDGNSNVTASTWS